MSDPRLLVPWDGAPPISGPRLPVTDPHSPSHWLDLDFVRSFSESMVRPWADHYFRATVHGAERIPAARPTIVAMNHSGMGWPWDAVLFMHRLGARSDYAREGLPRGFALPYFFQLPGLGALILRVGLWPARFEELVRLLTEGELVLYYPEGVSGIGKGWKKRYQVQRFHTSFVRAAVAARAPIVPCACIGAEGLNPLAVDAPPLAKATGLPIFPISPLVLALFPTWLSSAFFALPARIRYFVGEPLSVRLDPATATDDDYRAAAEELRVVLQRLVDDHRHDAPPGREPLPTSGPGKLVYRWRARDLALAALPMGWPMLYLRFWNAWQDAFPEGPPGGARYDKHPLDGLDEAAFLLPWGWPASLLRHRRAILQAGRRVAQALAPTDVKAPAAGARPSGSHLSGAGGEPRLQ